MEDYDVCKVKCEHALMVGSHRFCLVVPHKATEVNAGDPCIKGKLPIS